MPQRNTLLCTIGTSLFYPNLSRLSTEPQSDPVRAALGRAYSDKNWLEVAAQLRQIAPTERLCGAEINSVTDLLAEQEIERVNLHLLHSDTEDGKAIADVLQAYFKGDGWQVTAHRVEGLRDDDPKIFRTQGLRNLAKLFGELVPASGGASFCAIDATGGYKAQIAIAVLMGQALDIPVYYKHERFNAIISFPPMPVALDFSLWQQASGMFMALSKPRAMEPWKHFQEDWDERFEPLVNRERVDGKDYLELSATGQIFHETFRSRFQQMNDSLLPRRATGNEKRSPTLGEHSYQQAREPVRRFLQRLTDEVPYVLSCATHYWNPDLPQASRFRKSSQGIEGIYSDRTWCVRFWVNTTAESPDVAAVIADLNDWYHSRRE